MKFSFYIKLVFLNLIYQDQTFPCYFFISIRLIGTLRSFDLQLRRLWFEGQYVPGIPPDEIPDLNLCLFYQQLQVINCCISRKRRRLIATESLESVIRQASANVAEGTAPVTPLLYARISTGELVLRLGADKDFENLTMLETGEPVYTPIMQVWSIHQAILL